MKVVIPMAGTGDRYLRAGYTGPKPLIPVDGRPMIEHVIDLFPGERDFLFICNRHHLATTPLEKILRQKVPNCEIVAIESHKRGPVHTVLEAIDRVPDDDETIVNYCDFSARWDYADFIRQLHARRADGGISAYRGFHPHSLGHTLYAYMRVDADRWMQEIKEKGHFTPDRMQEFASAGTYYFARGAYVKKYFAELVEKNVNLNGEFYVSLVYNLMQRDGLRTLVHEMSHFLQWGTPEDLDEYKYWSSYFHDPRVSGR